MKPVKIETQIKNAMQAFIKENGLQNTDTTIDGIRYFLVTPNRFGQGYIRYITATQIWVADLKKNDPTQVTCVKLVCNLQSEEEKQLQEYREVLELKQDRAHMCSLSISELADLNSRIKNIFNTLLLNNVPDEKIEQVEIEAGL